MNNYYQLLLAAELDLAQQNPLLEAEYQFNEDSYSPLKIYDNYLPALKSYLISKPEFRIAHLENIQSGFKAQDSLYMQSN